MDISHPLILTMTLSLMFRLSEDITGEEPTVMNCQSASTLDGKLEAKLLTMTATEFME